MTSRRMKSISCRLKVARKPQGAPAVVDSLEEFQMNINLFSELSLVDLDWSNVVAAGSSVVTALLPVPEKYNGSRGLRGKPTDLTASIDVRGSTRTAAILIESQGIVPPEACSK